MDIKRYNLFIKRTYDKILFVIALCISAVCCLAMSQVDCSTITGWGYDLLECVKNGTVSVFPRYTYELRGMATNYTLFFNIMTALWLFPLYIVQTIMEEVYPLYIYELWYKVFIYSVYFADVFLFSYLGKILSNRGILPVGLNQNAELLMFMCHPLLLIPVLVQAQTEAFMLLLLFICIEKALDKKIITSAFFAGLIFLIKPYIILILIPVALLKYREVKNRLVNMILAFGFPFFLNIIITESLMPAYVEYAKKMSDLYKSISGLTRIAQMYSLQINHILIFFAVFFSISVYCLWLSLSEKSTLYHIIGIPLIVYLCMFAFVQQSWYHYAILIPFLIWIGRFFQSEHLFLLLHGGVGWGFIIHWYFSMLSWGYYFSYSIISIIFPPLSEPLNNVRLGEYREVVSDVGLTTCFASVMMCIIIGLKDAKDSGFRRDDNGMISKEWLLTFNIMPAVTFVIVSMFEYFCK